MKMEQRGMDAMTKMSLLSMAAKIGDLLQVKELVIQGHSLNAREENGATALHWASSQGHDRVCDYLLDAGCDINARIKNGPTALHVAVDCGHSQCVQVFIKRGVDLNACTERGDTPLHHAAYRGYLEILSLLTKAGADPCLRNVHGMTPLEEACAKKHSDCAQHLLNYITQRKVDASSLNSWKNCHDNILEREYHDLQHHNVTSPQTSLTLRNYQEGKESPKTKNHVSLDNRHGRNRSGPPNVSGVMSLDSDYSSMSLPYTSPGQSAPFCDVSLPSLGCKEEQSSFSFDSLLSKAVPIRAEYGSPTAQKQQAICDSITRGSTLLSQEESHFKVSSPPALPPRPSWLAKRDYPMQRENSASFNEICEKIKFPRQKNQWTEVLPGLQMSDFVEQLQLKVLELQEQLSTSQTSNVKLRRKVSQMEAENQVLKAENEQLLKSLDKRGTGSFSQNGYGTKFFREPVHGLSELDEGVHSSSFIASYNQSNASNLQSGLRISREPVETNDNV